MISNPKPWLCSVCGYVHHGDSPPEYCAVCGATNDLFGLQTEEQTKQQTTNPEKWRCLNCSYIHDGPSPPEYCSVCGAAADRFEPFTDSTQINILDKSKLKVIIVGAGIAGTSAAEALRKSCPKSEILLINKEKELPYYRLNLTRYLAGDYNEDHLSLHQQEWYEENDIQVLHDTELCSIDLDNKEIHLRDANTHTYDKLILTIGSHPFVPPFPGVNRENVTVLRTKDDADRILTACQSPIRCVCIGGGLLGLETATALARRNIDVTLLEGHGWILPRQLNKKAASLLESHITSLGIHLRKNSRTQEILGDERVQAILLEDGETIPADLVIITTGIRSNSYVARLAGLDVNQGVLVNDKLQTSDQDVYAAGDMAEHRGVIYGIWGPSQYQGTIAGMNAAGAANEFAGIPRSNILKVLGYDLFSIGQILIEDASYQVIDAELDNRYVFFVFRDNHMIGAILLGDTSLSAKVKKIIEKGVDCSEILQVHPTAQDIINFLKQYSL